MNKEQRSITSELRLSTDNRLVEGYALLFNTESRDLGGFTEIIEPESLNGVIDRSDVFCVLNHQNERGILARSKNGSGSLILEVDETGLKYLFEAPNTALGDELLEYLKRGDITGSSFAFVVKEDKWENRDGSYLRRIKSFDLLFDVSPVFNPAYEETTVAKRSLDNILEEQRNVEEAIKATEEQAKKEELDNYIKNLRESIK